MANPTRKSPGDRTLPAAEWNALIADVRALQQRLNLQQQSAVIPGAGVAMKITAVDGDFLECVRFMDGTVSTTTVIYVARPYLLRRSLTSWNGISFTYTNDQNKTATQGATSETWLVTPEYVVNDIIYAARVPNGTGLTNDLGRRIDWVDLNVDGRAWAEEST